MRAGELGPFDATMLVMGGIVGVGIFFTPRTVAALVPDPAGCLALWALGGAVALCGALTFAELGATFPRAGGWYVFLREGYGRFVAFLFAWIVLFVVSTGAVAVMMSFFTDTLRRLFPAIGPAGGTATVAIGALAIVAITALTAAGVKVGATFQNACMLVKLAAIAALVVGGLLVASAPESPVPVEHAAAASAARAPARWFAAILPVLFACGGWQMLCYLAPQVRDPQRTLPRAIVLGVIGVVVVYLAANATYLRVLGIDGLASDPQFASTVADRTLGPSGSRLLQAAMAVSALGVCAVTLIATPWMYVAMAREGLFFARFAALSPRTGAPIAALVVQAALCLAYWAWGQAGVVAHARLSPAEAATSTIVTPEVLTSSTVYVEWIFHALVALALLRLRRARPDLPRPFRSFAYPLAPLGYFAFACAVVLGNLAQANVRDTAIGLTLLAAGAAIYLPWRRYFAARAA